MTLSKLVLVALAASTNAECLSWCNPYTCADTTNCDTCSTCADLDAGTHCASWCNDYTCSSDYCTGCDGNNGNPDYCGYLSGTGSRCLSWCNTYTCTSSPVDCGGCTSSPNCADTSTFCEGWCNQWTTDSEFCVGC